MNFLLLLFIVAALLLVHLLRHALQLLRSPLRNVPGPLLARFTDIWYAWKINQGHFENVNLDLHKKYGSIVRYGPNRYSLSDPEVIKTVYGLGNHYAKSSWYTTWSSPGQWSIFNDDHIRRHAQNRKLYQATYAMSALVNYEKFVDDCADLFTQRLHEMAQSNLPIDIRHWFQCYAFDVIGMVTYGKRLGFLDRGDDIGGVIEALEEHLGYATLVGVFPTLHKYLFHLKNYLAGAKGAGRAYVITYTNERIREAQMVPKAMQPEENVHMEDFLTKFLARHASDPTTFTSYHVLAGCVSNMVAGSDTTAISLSAVLYYLLKNPNTLEKLKEEISNFTLESKISWPPSFKQTQEMPYLQAVIKEALRLHPATGLPLERVVPEGGATILGQFFPEGSVVGINTWVAHRDTRIWGDDASTFRPERWLETPVEKLSLMNRYWMPFGLGSRTCIGRHVSILEMSKLIPRIVRDFDFTLSGALKQEDWHTNNFWFVKPLDFKVQVQVRGQ